MVQGGVYSIRNRISQKEYIGSTVNLTNRWRAHLNDLRRGEHSNQHLQRAFDKHGEVAFDFSILERVEDALWLIPREQHYLDVRSPEYNILPRAGSPRGYRASLETRRKISEALTGNRHPMYGKHWSAEVKQNMSRAHMGHSVSDEQRRKQSEAMSGEQNPNYGKHPSEETRRKIGDAARGRRLSEETKRKIGDGLRIYARRVGTEGHHNYGKRHGSEAKQKMSEAALRLWSDDTHRQRMRESARRDWIHRRQARALVKEQP